MKPYSFYLFDLDGTLIDTMELILDCFRHTLRTAVGVEIDDEVILASVGLPLKEQYRLLLEPFQFAINLDELADRHMKHQLTRWRQTVTLKEGALETLNGLWKRGAKMAIVTSRRFETAQLYTSALGILEYINVLCCPEQTARHKPDPEPAYYALKKIKGLADQSLFVGDSVFDMQCGQAAGCDTCLVGQDREKSSLCRPPPTACIDNLMELL